MKHLRKISYTLFVLLTVLQTNAQHNELVHSINKYSLNLYQQTTETKENLFISPFSTYWALLAAYEGAEGKTKTECKDLLYLNHDTAASDFYAYAQKLINSKNQIDIFSISNAIWMDQHFQVKETFKKRVTENYATKLQTLDFAKKIASSRTINSWVSENTNNKIKMIISPEDINRDTKLIIANAIYFNAEWGKKFDNNLTKQEAFYTINKTTEMIDFMHSKESLKYYENNDLQFIIKPYTKSVDKSFCIILPKEKYGISCVENKIDGALLDTLFDNCFPSEIELAMPKYKLEKDYSLVQPLKEMGLHTAFSPQANFSSLSSQKPLFISNIKHKTFIAIDEERTEAAAATSIKISTTSIKNPLTKPIPFIADHPYIFMIIDNETKTILFMGRYVDPKD